MPQIYDLPAESLKSLHRMIPDDAIRAATDLALATPPRSCATGAARVHRLNLTSDQREGVLRRLRLMLARDGFEEGGQMLPIGHVYEGLIETFSQPSRCRV